MLSAKLQVRQTQSLVITPQLMQAIRLLQMSGLELERFIDAEVDQNPLLERSEEAAPDETGGADAFAGAELEAPDLAAGELFPEDFGSDAADGRTSAEISISEAGPPPDFAPTVGSAALAGPGSSDDYDRIAALAADESLIATLERDLANAFAAGPADAAVAAILLAELDPCGYVPGDLRPLAERLGVTVADAERVLKRCQGIAPSGLFARSLAECLALQLAAKDRLDPAMQTLLDHLPLLAEGNWQALCSLCSVDRNDLEEMIREIRALDPKPGLALERETAPIVVPDVFVRARPDGSWVVELNDETLPRILVNRSYHARVLAGGRSDADRRYLTDCLQKASWLEKSLDQRARTVLRVASEIVRRQEGFLTEGVPLLKPLNLRMVADALGVHESTVSRAAANKTIATPRGIFEFRFFFTGAIPASRGGEAHSAEAVKHRIRSMIGAEAPDDVLSDDAIVLRLSSEGVEIARRTVAKYRELMRIGSSVERRREKRLRQAS